MRYSILSGMLGAEKYLLNNLIVSGRNTKKLENIKNKLGVIINFDNRTLSENSDKIILSVKPDMAEDVIRVNKI